MCGRTALRLQPEEIRQRTGIENWIDESLYHPSSNVAPTHYQPILYLESAKPATKIIPAVKLLNDKSNSDSPFKPGELLPLTMRSMKWGLVVSKDDKNAGAHPINARDDSVMNPYPKPMFSRLRDIHRCVVIAQGFYEWQKKTGGHKIPYYVHHKKKDLLYMAAFYAVVEKDSGPPMYSYTVLTTSTTPNLLFLHDRLPVLLDQESLIQWLTPQPWSKTLELQVIQPRDTFLAWYKVDPNVGKAGLDDPRFMQPIDEVPNGLKAMWSRVLLNKEKEPGIKKEEDSIQLYEKRTREDSSRSSLNSIPLKSEKEKSKKEVMKKEQTSFEKKSEDINTEEETQNGLMVKRIKLSHDNEK